MENNDLSDFTPDTSDFTPDSDFKPDGQKYSATNLPPGLRGPAPNISGRPPLTSGFEAAKWGTGETLGGLGENIGGALAGMGQAVFQPPQNQAEKYLTMVPGGVQMWRMAQGLAPSPSQVAQVPGAIKDISESLDPMGFLLSALPRTLGQGAGATLTAGLLAKGGKGKAPLDSAGAATELANAVNPPAKNLAVFEQNLSKHFDKVTQYARDNNITINSRESLGKAMQGAADSQRAHYYDNILGPVRGESVSITDITGYDGAAQGSTAMLGDLDARLSQVNAELNPKYARGGIAGESAVKSAGALNAEAGAIRAKLYGELAKRTGLQATDIAGVRGSFGALRELSEKTGLAASKARASANALEQGPVTINPLSQTKHFLLDKAINAMRGDPAARAITKTINRAAVSPFSPPQPIFTEKVAVYRPEPIRTLPGSGDPVPSIFDRPEPAGVQGNPVRGPRPRPGANRVPLWKKMLAESLSEEK